MSGLGDLLGRRLSYEVVALHDTIGRRLGLTAVDHKYLDLIAREGPMSAGEISAKTGLTTGGVTALVDRLADAGFVERIPDKSDRRRVLVSAVGSRLAEIGQLMAPMGQHLAPTLANMSTEDIETVTMFLEGLIGAIASTRRDLVATDEEGWS